MSVEDFAPQLFISLESGEVESLNNIRDALSTLHQSHPGLVMFTDHSLAHSDAILKIISHILKGQNQVLNSIEGYLLIAAVYLHDIGLYAGEKLRDEKGHFPIQCWPHDLRQQHGRLSAAILQDINLQSKLSLNLPFLYEKSADDIALLCQIHNEIDSLKLIPSQTQYAKNVVRLRLLAGLLILGDNLHTGQERVLLDNIPISDLNLRSKLFWFSYSCIDPVEIDKATIHIVLRRSPQVNKKTFEEHVSNPVLSYLKNVLSIVNPVLESSDYRPLSIHCTTATGVSVSSGVTAALLTASAIETQIRDRNRERKRVIEQKLRKQGLIQRHKINNELVVLRRWSSYTPRMPQWNDVDNERLPGPEESRGGGYFLIWNKTGIVIDPGYDFLKNFWTQPIDNNDGFELDDISTVFVSHAHDDHSHDIEPIASLYYKRQKLVRRKGRLRVYSSEGTHIKYERLLNNNDYIDVIDLIPSNDFTSQAMGDSYLSSKGIELEFMRNKHNERPWLLNHTGVAIKLHLHDSHNTFTVGYTSDTRYFNEIVEFFRDADLLLLHFGNVGPSSTSPDPYDENHLGLNGCHDLLTNLRSSNVKLFLVDEFGEEEVGCDRIALCDLLGQSCSLESFGKVILPMDIGMRIQLSLPDIRIYCQERNHDHFMPCNQIKAHLPAGSEGIVYYC